MTAGVFDLLSILRITVPTEKHEFDSVIKDAQILVEEIKEKTILIYCKPDQFELFKSQLKPERALENSAAEAVI